MRLILLALLLVSPIVNAAQTWPEAEGRTFIPDSATQQIVLCRPVLGCTPPKTFTGPTNCGYYSFAGNFPADPSYPGQCKPYEAPEPPPIAPPVVVAPRSFCVPVDFLLGSWSKLFRVEPVMAADSSRYQWIVAWKDPCDGTVDAQLYSDAERDALENRLVGMFLSGDPIKALNAWVAGQQTTTLTRTEFVVRFNTIEKWSPQCAIQRGTTAANTRPVYALKADGTRNTTAVKGKTVNGGTRCRAGKRIGTTSYYSVQGANFSDGSPIGDLDYYAVGSVVDPLTQ